ncbi:MAG TPA: hypothetical protein VKR32_08570 [Puia sp.]|nr:hypothetical protein [Puia sp.]
MKTSVYTKIFVLLLLVFGALALVSYARSRTAGSKEDCSVSGKGDSRKVQGEFIIWEAFSKTFMFPTSSCDE